MIAVLHDLSPALEFADEIAVINGGEIKLFSSADRLINSNILETAFGVETVRTEHCGSYLYNFVKKT